MPTIGASFEAIFKETVAVNTLDTEQYEKVQQTIIDALDKGRAVYVRGAKGNETDITVQLPVINNPARETNFYNCVADVNIPVGEVFTSPKLEGTNGVLHLEEIYLEDLQYKNLRVNSASDRITGRILFIALPSFLRACFGTYLVKIRIGLFLLSRIIKMKFQCRFLNQAVKHI